MTLLTDEGNNSRRDSAVAGCRAFFSADGIGGDGPFTIESLNIGNSDGVYTIASNHNPSRIDAMFAWSPARGPLATVVSERQSRQVSSHVRLVDPRRHTSFEVPGTMMIHPLSKGTYNFCPTHVFGQPVLTAIARGNGVASAIIM